MWKKFRFWLFKVMLNITISIIDKDSVEGVSFIITIREWINYLNQIEMNKAKENNEDKEDINKRDR